MNTYRGHHVSFTAATFRLSSVCAQPPAHACVRGRGAHACYHSRRDNDVEREDFTHDAAVPWGLSLEVEGCWFEPQRKRKLEGFSDRRGRCLNAFRALLRYP